ncbi:MAG TPA: DUF1080 domain-containing protein, partial [Planctomycetaceae bacterium]|nr:DUF1080 domain-containing protein [Planctomycetaceae bacterium]
MKTIFVAIFSMGLAVSDCGANGPQSTAHPDSRHWETLFAPDLSDAVFPSGVWSFTDGVLTVTQDECIWTEKEYDNFVLDLEFKTAKGTNSGVIVYGT